MPIKTRGLESGFEQPPLREFKGILNKTEQRAVSSETWGPSVRNELYFTDVEVIESTEPYMHPVAMISIKHSDKESSVWGVFAKSFTSCVPDGVELDADTINGIKSGPDCIGHRMHLKMTPGHTFGKDRETKEPIVKECWECQSVEGYEGVVPGAAPVTAKVRALQLLDGKANLQDWHGVVFTDAIVKTDPDITAAILAGMGEGGFLPPLIAGGVVTQDEKGFHVNLAAV